MGSRLQLHLKATVFLEPLKVTHLQEDSFLYTKVKYTCIQTCTYRWSHWSVSIRVRLYAACQSPSCFSNRADTSACSGWPGGKWMLCGCRCSGDQKLGREKSTTAPNNESSLTNCITREKGSLEGTTSGRVSSVARPQKGAKRNVKWNSNTLKK